MPWSVWIFVGLVAALSIAIAIEEYLWQGKFCGCCLRRKAECNCGPECHWCQAKGDTRIRRR